MFSRPAMPVVTNTSQPTVIGRLRIDNYLMGVIFNKGDLIDGTLASQLLEDRMMCSAGIPRGH